MTAAREASWRVGIDVGGTFTDLAAVELNTGALRLRKVPSTPPDLDHGAAAAARELGESLPLDAVALLSHGTTVGTNALIEGTGARTGLITTRGFRDLLEIARQQRPSLYDLTARKPPPLVARHLRREVTERLRHDGGVVTPLDLGEAKSELRRLAEAGIEALAICFLHSYADPTHERAVREAAAEALPGVYLSASCDLLPRFREYERLSTTVVNAYLGPLVSRYLERLADGMSAIGVRAALHIMQSNGGLAPVAEARSKPATTVLSGPAAGAAAAAALSTQLGLARAISVDMGGTSTDVCLIEGGLPASAPGREVGGYPVELPGVDVRCLGAGGGSIFTVEAGGLPRVGPTSAGARPGPACYLLGGEEATLTDAFLLTGRLPPAGLLGGRMPLHPEAAHKAIARRAAQLGGMRTEEAALGAVKLAVAGVRRAIEGMTVSAGRDPRDFSLIAAGGAGPLVACELASELGIREVIVPRWPGTFSACGLVVSDLRRDWVQTCLVPANVRALPRLTDTLQALEAEAAQWLADNATAGDRSLLLRRLSARYAGQDYELPVGIPEGPLSAACLQHMIEAFHAAHELRYGYALPEAEVELVDLTVSATSLVARPRAAATDDGPGERGPSGAARRAIVTPEGARADALVCPRDSLAHDSTVLGPALIEQHDSTTYLPSGHRARVVEGGHLRIATEGMR